MIVNGQLYNGGYSVSLLKCIDKAKAQYVMAELYEGIYGHHLGGRSLSEKILKARYYWPTMKVDCMKYV